MLLRRLGICWDFVPRWITCKRAAFGNFGWVGELRPAGINSVENIIEVLTQLDFVLEVVLFTDITDTDAVAEILHQVPSCRRQQKMILVKNHPGVILDEILIMLELSTVSDAVQLMFHLVHNLLHFITVNFRVALHSKISIDRLLRLR